MSTNIGNHTTIDNYWQENEGKSSFVCLQLFTCHKRSKEHAKIYIISAGNCNAGNFLLTFVQLSTNANGLQQNTTQIVCATFCLPLNSWPNHRPFTAKKEKQYNN